MLVVVGALMTIVVVSLNGIDDDDASRECQTELRAIKAASEQFHAELGVYPADDQALKDAHLMEPEESPNWRVVTPEGSDQPRYEAVGSRCA